MFHVYMYIVLLLLHHILQAIVLQFEAWYVFVGGGVAGAKVAGAKVAAAKVAAAKVLTLLPWLLIVTLETLVSRFSWERKL